jgi:phosphomannomutase
LLYFSLFQLPVDSGVMITASHNPSEYNGFKLCIGKETIYGEEIQKIRELMEREEFATGNGSIREEPDMIPRYIKHVSSRVGLKRPVKCVADAEMAWLRSLLQSCCARLARMERSSTARRMEIFRIIIPIRQFQKI